MIETALFNHEAEACVVGSLAMAPEMTHRVLDIAPVEAYTDPMARAAMEILEQAVSAGLPSDRIDVKLLAFEMRNRGDDIAMRAVDYLIHAGETTPTAANAEYYAKEVRRCYEKRRYQSMGLRLQDFAQNGKSPAEIHEWLTNSVADLQHNPIKAVDVWADWRRGVEELGRTTRFKVADHNSQFNRLNIGPNQVVLIGGPPGRGKTIVGMQLTVDALTFDESLRAVVANCEMAPGTLLDRQLARLAQVPYSVIRDRTFDGDRRQAAIEAADDLHGLKDRLHFMSAPFTMSRLKAQAASVKADIVLVDYVQRFKLGGVQQATDPRQQVSDVMSAARELAMSGPAVIVISAMSRGGQFRESSELEYGCDSAYTLECEDEGNGPVKDIVAKCHKNRHGAPEDIRFEINGKYQEATAEPEVQPWDI